MCLGSTAPNLSTNTVRELKLLWLQGQGWGLVIRGICGEDSQISTCFWTHITFRMKGRKKQKHGGYNSTSAYKYNNIE